VIGADFDCPAGGRFASARPRRNLRLPKTAFLRVRPFIGSVLAGPVQLVEF
jgi:hypothetical protein